MATHTLRDIAALLDVTPPTADLEIDGINTLAEAGPRELSFFGDARYRQEAEATKAGALLVSPELADAVAGRSLLVVDRPDVAIYQVLSLFDPPVPRPEVGVDPAAHVAASATLGAECRVGPNVFIGEHATIGAGCVLHAGCHVFGHVTVGDHCELFPGVVIRERTRLGNGVVVHANVALGTDGFGYKFDGRAHRKLPHVGGLVVGNDVEIGAGTTIDRGKFSNTEIGAGTKIDNLVQIAHNVRIGRACIVCANVGIAGSTTLGDGVIIAGGAGLKDHIHIGTGARVGGFTGVHADVPDGTSVLGAPARPQRDYLREQAASRRLPDLLAEVRSLRQRLDKLEKSAST